MEVLFGLIWMKMAIFRNQGLMEVNWSSIIKAVMDREIEREPVFLVGNRLF